MTLESLPLHPLAEVFGFPPDNLSPRASRYRTNNLCPFNNRVPSCTKDKANAPLGVCTIHSTEGLAITCPIRFRQDWLIAEDAAAFFFPGSKQWTSLTEVRINDANGKSAGNIDIVLVAYNNHGHVVDFGSLEVQAVYISGNIRNPFEFYMEDPEQRFGMDWSTRSHYPRADYLSSSRKRLAPQLIYKGGILNAWGKKMAVALHRGFRETLPPLPEVDPKSANLAWFIYDLEIDSTQNVYQLVHSQTVYTQFKPALDKLTTPEPGSIEDFIDHLQGKLDEHLEEHNPPDAPTLTDILEA